MTGILLIDKPSGLTSHDVVARVRRSSGERSVGHTGTLDPRATGLLPLVLGGATRLAGVLTGSDKTYEATIQLGVETETDDADGRPIGDTVDVQVDLEALDAALERFLGTYDQLPPRHSAKKIGGEKADQLARRDEPVVLKPVAVTVHRLDRMTGLDGGRLCVRVTAGAGFYVRALARDLGRALGCGAHLADLRRTRSGAFDVADAIPLEGAESLGRGVSTRILSPSDALPGLPAVHVTAAGLKRAAHGNPLAPDHLEEHWIPPASTPGPVKVLAADGRLVALAHSRGGALHPVVVLG